LKYIGTAFQFNTLSIGAGSLRVSFSNPFMRVGPRVIFSYCLFVLLGSLYLIIRLNIMVIRILFLVASAPLQYTAAFLVASHHQTLNNGCNRLYATPIVESAFPSDDSDYEQTNGSSSSKTQKQHDNKSRDTQKNNNNSYFQPSEIYHPTQSQIKLGDQIIVDPIDVIADYISNIFAEQSLQWKSSNNEDAKIKTNSDGGSSYVMESYSPGSALDTIAQASSTLTPLSYQIRTVVRVVLPSILVAIIATIVYPSMAQWLIQLPSSTYDGVDGSNGLLYTDDVLTVLSNDLSQYVQNILTTCALLFGMLVGQTYYFMYQQQELVFYALFEEVTEAKSLLEQISLMTYGRPGLYPSLISRMNDYVQNDLKVLSTKDPIAVTSGLPKDDPLESILYATSVGLPGVVYETVKSLRQARANRCGALQRKLPALHIYCLRLLGVIVLSTFPVCGSGSQAIAPNVLVLQQYLFGILAFALTLVLNVVEELRNARKLGAYNVDGILEVMVGGLEQELQERLDGKVFTRVSPSLPIRVSSENEDEMRVNDNKLDDLQGDEEVESTSPSRRYRLKNWLLRRR